MSLTKEQQVVVDTIMRDDVSLVKVEACAGSGKTHTLIEVAKVLNPAKGLYIAYNKAIQQDAEAKFKDTSIQCLTVHSLAYRSTVKQYGLKPGWFNARDVTTTGMIYPDRKLVVDMMEDFLTSIYTDPQEYLDDHLHSTPVGDSMLEHLDLMADGSIDCPHSFYLKMFHVLLKLGQLPVIAADLVLMDELGDVNAVILDIFRLIKSPKKVAVGDSMQNIYSFNNTINGFMALEDEGVTVKLTTSFRVSEEIASSIQYFVRSTLASKFEFKGRSYPNDYPIKSRAYIARNNTSLVEEMLELKLSNIPFHTTRKIDTILEIPLALANLSNGKPVLGSKLKTVEKLRKEWAASKDKTFLKKYPKPLNYVMSKLKTDKEIFRAYNVVRKYGPHEINLLTRYVNACAGQPCDLTLTTAHSSKGLEFDSVTLAPDFNDALATTKVRLAKAIIENDIRGQVLAEEEYRLYYVACSRSLVELNGADALRKTMIKG